MRLAVLFYRRRAAISVPYIQVRAEAEAFRIDIDADWLARNPLTVAALRAEIREWEKIGFDVKISGLYDVDDGAEFEAAR